jgi:hypothetical protein
MRKASSPSALLIVAVASQLGATDCGTVIRDSAFDLWCGEELCAWKVTRGEIKRVSTWNEGDSGVELVGADVAIQQLSPVNNVDGTCLKFTLVANVDDKSEVFLDIDIEGDGTVERSERIPTSNWKPLSYNIAVAAPYDGVRFEITKRGTGKAQLANIGAKTVTDECDGLEPLDPGPRKDGAMCDQDGHAQCASGLCIVSPTPIASGVILTWVCGGCDPKASACGTGNVCGVGEPFSPLLSTPTACVPTASKQLGEQCLSDGECDTGLCWRGALAPLGVCSTCRLDSNCSGGQLCSPSWDVESTAFTGPFLCGANQMLVASGGPCATDDDCASGHCDGAVRAQCSDGRTCSSPADCPFGTGDADPLQNGACDTVGVQGGTCQ